MTSNQIAYWNLQETKRSNKARETETHRNNLAVETETNRANVAREKQNKINSDRDFFLNLINFREKVRATRKNEEFTKTQLIEQERHNRATEKQQQQQQYVAMYNAETQRSAVRETKRSNIMNEQLTQQRQAEQTRTNKANENIKLAQTAEASRSNKANEALQHFRNIETMRSNRSNEYLTSQKNKNDHERNEIQRIANQNQANLIAETKRHNSISEMLSLVSTIANYKSSKYATDSRLLGSLTTSVAKSVIGGLP